MSDNLSTTRNQKTSGGDDDDIPMTFPQRLMDILCNAEHSDVISWLPHGNGFIVFKKKKFAAEVLPKYFKQSKFTSFTRKLNRWGFTRITRGPETGSYYHKFFLRDHPQLCLQMSCQNPRFQNEEQFKIEQPYQLPSVSTMAHAFNSNPILTANPGLLKAQMQQKLQQLQQEHQLQTELLRRAMATRANAVAAQAQLLTQVDGVSSNANYQGNKEEILLMQMMAQGKAPGMPMQPLLSSISSSSQNWEGSPAIPLDSESKLKDINRASVA